jgi:hypothetical protein
LSVVSCPRNNMPFAAGQLVVFQGHNDLLRSGRINLDIR